MVLPDAVPVRGHFTGVFGGLLVEEILEPPPARQIVKPLHTCELFGSVGPLELRGKPNVAELGVGAMPNESLEVVWAKVGYGAVHKQSLNKV